MKTLQLNLCVWILRPVVFILLFMQASTMPSAFNGGSGLSHRVDRSHEELSYRWRSIFLKTFQSTKLDEPLRIGESVERSIKSDETHQFSIDLRPGQMLQINLKEKGSEVRVGIYLNGKVVVSEVNFGTGFGRERCNLIVEQPGKYSVHIWASKFSIAGGGYQFIASLRDEATENDKKEIEAQKLLMAGFESRSRRTAEGLLDAISKWKKARSIWTELGDSYWAGFTGNLLGVLCNALGRNKDALSFYQQSLTSMISAGDLSGQSKILANIGNVYSVVGNKPKALNYYQRSLVIDQKIGDLSGQAITLNNIGSVLTEMAHPDQALGYHNQALPLFERTDDELGRATTFNNIGRAYEALGENQKALDHYKDKALPLFASMRQTPGSVRGQATALNNIAGIYDSLGDKRASIKNFEDALTFWKKIGDTVGLATTYNNLGIIHNKFGENEKALGYLKDKALPLWIESDDVPGQAATFDAIGLVYLDQDKREAALEYFEKKALPLWINARDKGGEATTRNNIGSAYYSWGDRTKALQFFNQAMLLWIEAGDQRGQALTLSNMMAVWSDLQNPTLAILYGKTSLKLLETLRSDIKKADTELQKSFVRSAQNTYQSLAELLIKEKQFDQAVHILDLYRAQQFFDFGAGEQPLTKSIALSTREQEFVNQYATFLGNSRQINLQIDELIRDLSDHEPTEQEKAQLQKLKNEHQLLVDKFYAAFKEIETAFSGPAENKDEVHSTVATDISDFLQASNQHAVVVYTLIGVDEFHLLLIDKKGIKTFSVPIKGKVLSDKAREFAASIRNVDSGTGKPNIDVTDQAKELYNVIFKPIEYALPKDTTTIMWNLDGNLRYVPINALHDGKDYLVRRKLNNVVITRTDLKAVTESPNPKWQATGFSVTKELKKVINLDISHDFPALVAGESEMNGIFNSDDRTRVIFVGKPFVDSAFTKDVMLGELRKERAVVHISSHFKIQPGDLSRSFLVLGDGQAFSLLDMKKEAQSFPNGKLFSKVELLTLSACDTGISEADADGREVDSFADLAQRFGAASVLATLWSVNECSTAELMKLFYRNKIYGGMNKAEAVRQAQLALLDGTVKSSTACRAKKGNDNEADNATSATTKIYKVYKENLARPFAHPYYWSPFILYGNWK